jgi:CRP-like cAMP-binding protein
LGVPLRLAPVAERHPQCCSFGLRTHPDASKLTGTRAATDCRMRELGIGIIEELTPNLAPAQVDRLCQAGSRITCGRGEVIYRQGEPARHIFVLLEGEAQSTLLNFAGNETLLRIHLPGSILGLTALASVPWRDATAKANQASVLAKVSAEHVREQILSDPGLGLSLIQLLVDRMRDFHFRVGDLQALSVEQRLARVLLAVSRREREVGAGDQRPEVHLTHEELAQLVGSRRQTITGVLGRFMQAGYISKAGRRLYIEDVGALMGLMP